MPRSSRRTDGATATSRAAIGLSSNRMSVRRSAGDGDGAAGSSLDSSRQGGDWPALRQSTARSQCAATARHRSRSGPAGAAHRRRWRRHSGGRASPAGRARYPRWWSVQLPAAVSVRTCAVEHDPGGTGSQQPAIRDSSVDLPAPAWPRDREQHPRWRVEVEFGAALGPVGLESKAVHSVPANRRDASKTIRTTRDQQQ